LQEESSNEKKINLKNGKPKNDKSKKKNKMKTKPNNKLKMGKEPTKPLKHKKNNKCFLGTHVASKNSFDAYFMEIGPQFPSLVPNLPYFMHNPQLGMKVKNEVQIGGELGMIL
jgi:hypothetical protein